MEIYSYYYDLIRNNTKMTTSMDIYLICGYPTTSRDRRRINCSFFFLLCSFVSSVEDNSIDIPIVAEGNSISYIAINPENRNITHVFVSYFI